MAYLDKAFDDWWAKAKVRLNPDTLPSRSLAHVAWAEAWRLAWEAGRLAVLAEGLDTMVSVTVGEVPLVPGAVEKRPFGGGYHTPLVKSHHDWHKLKAEIEEAGKLAERHGLVIMDSMQGAEDPTVTASRGNPSVVVAVADGWAEMIRELKAMEKLGQL